ncbi:MAG: triose-phosphate isomerase [Microscillaceae bacterium]|nr:triose-phosphate isomerase [Microscillaceae bacterium]MDW8460185.1 triose-phosphate isomerase [Cytophagales bacterium]
MRKKIVAGNWKMNKTLPEGLALASEILTIAQTELSQTSVEIILAVPFVHLYPISKMLAQSTIQLGAQNCYHKPSGAFTGEVSAEMLASIPVRYCLVGHSERRQYFQEHSQQLAEKVNLLLKNNIHPIFCCGETLAERNAGGHEELVCQQISEGLFHLPAEEFAQIVIAYEPVWAIGTGINASSEQAQAMHAVLRKHIASHYGETIAQNCTILYGGSCNPSNAPELFACPDVDGGLIGGASLKARDFIEIVKSRMK